MKRSTKIIIAVAIILGVTLLAIFQNNYWLMLLYGGILAIFPNEIKRFFIEITNIGNQRIRVSYAYLFRIMTSGLYLLVKDEQGRDEYHPVGGVYKYDPDRINMAERFEGEYDGAFAVSTDTNYDLRLTINKKKFDYFDAWFKNGNCRETEANLGREFKEELIDKNIFPADIFKNIKYKYLGSTYLRGVNERLNIHQVRHFDVYDVCLTNNQKKFLYELSNMPNKPSYVFANARDIEKGFTEFAGRRYQIAKTAQYILVENKRELTCEKIPSQYYISI